MHSLSREIRIRLPYIRGRSLERNTDSGVFIDCIKVTSRLFAMREKYLITRLLCAFPNNVVFVSTLNFSRAWANFGGVSLQQQDLEKLKKLLRDGASPEGNHDNGGSALHRCVHTKQVAMTRHLIEAGADVNFQVVRPCSLLIFSRSYKIIMKPASSYVQLANVIMHSELI